MSHVLTGQPDAQDGAATRLGCMSITEQKAHPTLELNDTQLQWVSQRALIGYPAEVCGAIFGQRADGRAIVEALEQIPNQCQERSHLAYQMDLEKFLEREKYWRDRGQRVLGFWHSHPNGKPIPSSADGAHAWSGYSYLIVAADSKKQAQVRSWRFENGRFLDERLVL